MNATPNFKDELNDVKHHAREAARATLLAMRTGIDAAISFLEERREPDDARDDAAAASGATRADAPPTATTANDAQPEGSMVPPSMPDDKPPGANV